MVAGESWDREMLMGITGPMAGKGGADAVKANPMLYGRAGHLTEEEADVCIAFKEEIERRDENFSDTIYSFGEEEGEVWALLRWCRARKFVYDDIITMVEEATDCRAEAKAADFYRDPKAALGCDMAVYMAQFPQVYSGYSKEGIPLFFSKPGVFNVDAVETITTVEGILKFHWFYMNCDFGDLLRNQKATREGFERFECICVVDLAHLSVGQLGSRTLNILKQQAFIDSLCFPETLNRTVVVNAPTFFTATWRIIKGWLDARTVGKIDVFSSRSTWEPKLLEIIDKEELPSDYGGTGPSTVDTLNSISPGDMKRLYTEVMYVRSSGSYKTEVAADEEVEIMVWTRSVGGAKFAIVDQGTKKEMGPTIEVKHTGGKTDQDFPTETNITPTQRIAGPVELKIKADSNSGRFSTDRYLVCVNVYAKST